MAKDMTKGNPGKTLFFFAVPMVLGNLFQQLYNIIDSVSYTHLTLPTTSRV